MATNTTVRQLVCIVLAIVAAFVLLPALTMGFGVMGTGPMMGSGWGHGMWGGSDVWGNIAYGVAAIGVVATALVFRKAPLAVRTEAIFGVLAVPLGLPAVYDAYRRSVQR